MEAKRGSNNRTKVSKGHNSYSRHIKIAATSVLRGWLRYVFYQWDFSQAQSSLLNNKRHCFVSRNLPDNFEIYDDFKISNGQGMRSTKLIQPIFGRNLYFIIKHHPFRLHQIQLKTTQDMVILKNSNGRGLCSTKPIQPIFERNCILSFYIILPNFIKIGKELFEIIDINTYRLTDRQTHTRGWK